MDRISALPDDLCLKVLLFLPTKVAIRTSVLSKRWEFLWMWLPKLEYSYSDSSESERLQSFINMNLPIHKAPVIESLCLKFSEVESCGSIKPKDIILCVRIAVFRCVRELTLKIFHFDFFPPTNLPSRLYTCKSLVVLKLVEDILLDVPRMAYLPSLKTLVLQCVKYKDNESLHQLLSSCPILEDLFVERGEYNYLITTLCIIVPSLQRLALRIYTGDWFDSLFINTPSLKCFKVVDHEIESNSENYTDGDIDNGRYSFECNDMPKLEEAEIDSSFPNMDKFVRSVTYVKRLSLCIPVNADEPLYREGIVFNKLQHLKLCSCVSNWPKLLFRLLKDSPNLREVEVYKFKGHGYVNPVLCLENQLNPECLFSRLETFEWTTGIYGTQREMDLAKYILKYACCLKTATILFQTPNELEEDYKVDMMKQELSLSFKASKTCQLVFE